MNTIKFAQLVSNITRQHAISFTEDELQDMLDTIEAGIKSTEVVVSKPTHDQIVAAAGAEVKLMLESMRTGKKIEAIKACRMLTGYGLKEAKDAIEMAQTPQI